MLSSIDKNIINTVWHKSFFDASKSRLSNEEYSAKFFGLLLCQVLINREETWFFIKQDVARGMMYFREKVLPKIKKEEAKVKDTVTFDDLKNKFGD